MHKLKLIDYLLIAGIIAIVVLLAIGIARPTPCVETLDVTKGKNFNQPILTEHNCKAGELPTNWQDFEPKR